MSDDLDKLLREEYRRGVDNGIKLARLAIDELENKRACDPSRKKKPSIDMTVTHRVGIVANDDGKVTKIYDPEPGWRS